MNELEIYENKILPYLIKIGYPKELISDYGRVPARMGTEQKWADVVLYYINKNGEIVPYIVIEVKRNLDNLHDAKAQSESYSKQLNTFYFAVTDGDEYIIYNRLPDGKCIKISSFPVPEREYITIKEGVEVKPNLALRNKINEKLSVKYSRELYEAIDRFFEIIRKGCFYYGDGSYTLRTDTLWHYLSVKKINELIHKKITSLTPDEFEKFSEEYTMATSGRPKNKLYIKEEIKNNFDKIKMLLQSIKNIKNGDIESKLEKLRDRNSDAHVKGMGIFAISEYLAGAYPQEFTIVEENMVNKMKDFGILDFKVDYRTSKGYLYINEICKNLYKDIFRQKIEKNKNSLGFEIDEDFGLILIHEFFWEYHLFYDYKIEELEKAEEEDLKREKADATEKIREIEQFIR